MAEGYLGQSATNTNGLTYDAMLYCKTNIAGYFFDGFINVDYSSELEVTSNPVETGVSVADHSYRKPREIVMSVMMSDVHQSLVPGQFDGGWSRSVSAYGILENIQNNRIPISVLTRLGLYENMIIHRLQAKDDFETYQALSATVTLVELPIARVKTVEISAASQTTITTEMGKLQAVEANDKENESILYMLGFGAGGNKGSENSGGGSRMSISSREAFVQVAQGEIGVSEPKGDDKYIVWYNSVTSAGFDNSVSWCAIFVSWCARHAGISTSELPNYSSCNDGMSMAKGNQTWRNRINYTPKKGDVVIFQKPSSMHTGIVEKVSGTTVYTIEGNSGDPGAVRQRQYNISNTQILGYIDWDMS